ncbi:LamG-like jellyroll fold domain-containing protein [Haloarchaeobius iranensis]|uniref:Flagellin N-terminal-like domain-containing protein n=1 Tax=Haloarchaeobius iranensis TaxID=996166 RepID=A0A1H0BE45_9EURY|nr:LamG-like jellyroll fold domain-containing protein [Haloarchaeobius iranensis]SDN43693.1 flagellin N-terminal-like domain-containing protein [Haloarchaeobius iranensis]
MRGKGSTDRAATSPIGTLLLVALAIVAAAGVGVFVLDLSSGQGAPTAEAAFEYRETPAGLEMTAVGIGEDVVVQLNGQPVASFDSDEAGKTVLLPTAPDDRITVVSRDGDQTVLVNRRVDDRDEVGDLIAYYTFDQGTGSTIVDRSGNGNDGTAFRGWSRVTDDTGTAIELDGTSGTHVDIGDLSVDGPASVDEITIAIEYEKDGGPNRIQNLIEHQAGGFAWYMETDGNHVNPHRMEYTIGYSSPPSGTLYADAIDAGESQVLIGTFDGDEMVLYRNGQRVDSVALDRDVELGEVILGADSDPYGVGQNIDGRIYEVRLYYTSFSDSEAAVLTRAMRNNSTAV